jgi:hypothetical protein
MFSDRLPSPEWNGRDWRRGLFALAVAAGLAPVINHTQGKGPGLQEASNILAWTEITEIDLNTTVDFKQLEAGMALPADLQDALAMPDTFGGVIKGGNDPLPLMTPGNYQRLVQKFYDEQQP